MKRSFFSEARSGAKSIRLHFLATTIAFLVACHVSFAQTAGVTDAEIVIGQSCALEGPTKVLGQSLRRGAQAYFQHVNDSGGINGRTIRLVSYDDGYEPKACLENTTKLIEQDQVFLLFGYVGTPTSKEILPLVTDKKVPFFAPFTGAEFLRNPVNPFVFNIRPSYSQETEAIVEKLLAERGISRISVFYQDDSYGKAGLEGVVKALEKRNLVVVNHASYPRNSVNVEKAVDKISSVSPEAVIMVGIYDPCAKFIQQMKSKGSKAIFLNVSPVGANALGNALLNEGAGVVVAQVVPFPFDRRIPVVVEYKKRLGQYFPDAEPEFVSMEGYIAAKALCDIIEQVPEPITREAFVQTAESQTDKDIGGFSFTFGPGNHQGSDRIYFTQIAPGGFLNPIDNLKHLY